MTNVRLKEVVTKATDKDFYNQFFTASNVTAVIGYLGQVVSALTEFHLFFNSTGGVYSPLFKQENVLPILAGLFAVFLFEFLGVRVYLVRIIRQIVNKDFGSWERWILFGFNMLFVLVLCGANLVSSWLGQSMTFAAKTNITTTDKTHRLELEKTTKIENKNYHYDNLKTSIIQDYEIEKASIIATYKTDIKELKNSRYTFRKDKEKYDSYTSQIDTKLATKTTSLNNLKTQFNSDKNDNEKARKKAILLIERGYDRRILDISQKENASIELWLIVQKYTLPLLIVFILLSWVSIVYREIFQKGSGQKIEIKEVRKRPLLIVDFIKGVYDMIYYFFYWLTSFVVGDKKVIYDNFRQQEINYLDTDSFRKKDEKSLKVAASLRREIGFKTGKSQSKSKDIPPFIPPFTPPFTLHSELKPLVKGNLKKGHYGDRLTVNVESTKQVNEQRKRICKNCGESFIYKHWNKRFCNDECRINHWEKKTGKTLTKKSKK